jgi:hypothetical protein
MRALSIGSPRHLRGLRHAPALGVPILVAVLLFVPTATRLFAQAAREADVEAAYLFNFGKFMRVASHESSPEFRIGILGDNPFGGTLEQLTAHEVLDGRPMRVVPVTTAEEARSCDILFLGDGETSRLEHDLAMLNGSPVLTVSRIRGFADRGGMIQFVLEQDRVRFAVNLEAADHAHIQLSSELLKLAVQVTRQPGMRGPG